MGGVKYKRDLKFIVLLLLFLIAPVESETLELFCQDAKRKKFSDFCSLVFSSKNGCVDLGKSVPSTHFNKDYHARWMTPFTLHRGDTVTGAGSWRHAKHF